MIHQLPSEWRTKRLLISDGTVDDSKALQQIHDACAYIGKWSGDHSPSTGKEMEEELRHNHLPPNGKKELHRVQKIQNDVEETIGYLILYHSFPDIKTFWIATLAIHPNAQRKKYGQEVIDALTKQVENIGGYSKIGGSVAIQNWAALSFWLQNGFDRILKIEGDRECSETTFANLWLVKEL